MSNTSKVNNHSLNGILKTVGASHPKPWAAYKPEEKEKLIAAVKPTRDGAKVIAVQPPMPILGQVRKLDRSGEMTKRARLLELGLKGAYHEDFNSDKHGNLSSIGFWKGAFQDPSGGYGWVIEEHPVKDGKAKRFCYYVFPEGTDAIPYKEVKPVKKAEKKAKAAAPTPKKKAS